MRVLTVPVLEDNYAYLLVAKDGSAAAVDPAEAEKVAEAARVAGVRIRMVLTTHRHQDHAGGNVWLKEIVPDVEIVGGSEDPIPGCTKKVTDETTLQLGDITIWCLRTPFHTADHMCYVATCAANDDDEVSTALFSGDTLFLAGTGRCFTGDPAAMHASLERLNGTLPPETRIYCGHEYALKNLEFAAEVEPENAAVMAKLQWARAQRANGRPTVPSTLREERSYNPFLRWDCASVMTFTGESEPVAVLAALRSRKDHFGWDASIVSHAVSVIRAITWPARQLGLIESHWP